MYLKNNKEDSSVNFEGYSSGLFAHLALIENYDKNNYEEVESIDSNKINSFNLISIEILKERNLKTKVKSQQYVGY